MVNNGARLQLYPLTKTPLKVDRAILDVNTVGTISLTKAILPHMIKRQEGQIVVVSSAVGKHGNILQIVSGPILLIQYTKEAKANLNTYDRLLILEDLFLRRA